MHADIVYNYIGSREPTKIYVMESMAGINVNFKLIGILLALLQPSILQ